MSAIEPADKPLLTITRRHLVLIVLIALLLLLVGFSLGFNYMTVRDLAGQAVSGLIGLIGAAAIGGKR